MNSQEAGPKFRVFKNVVQAVMISDYDWFEDNQTEVEAWLKENGGKRDNLLIFFPDEQTLFSFNLRFNCT